MTENSRQNLSIGIICIIVGLLLFISLLARAAGPKTSTIKVHLWNSDDGSLELVRVNETDKVVTISQPAWNDGWRCVVPEKKVETTTGGYLWNNGQILPAR